MQYPRHLILDVNLAASQHAQPAWAQRYLLKLHLPHGTQYDTTPSNRAAHRPTTTTVAVGAGYDATLVHFLRKEVIYTKLKYSRCPQYDIVSGGMAALFSAFLGFLISEKFGIELVDSGDFYFAFMYGVFLVFACRPLLKLLNVTHPDYQILSPKHLLSFYYTGSLKACQYFYRVYTLYQALNLPSLPRIVAALRSQEQVTVWWKAWCYMIRFLKNYPLKVD